MKKIFSSYVWSIPTDEKIIYLTFDDGPHPTITPYVLNELKKHNAHATFFCIGNNVNTHPKIFQMIIDAGHAVGNHTYDHLNGWETNANDYLTNIEKASELIDSNLFRPPYGRIKKAQAKGIANAIKKNNAQIIMWDVLSADFDQQLSQEGCLQNVLRNATNGSIIVFHDSEKAYPNLSFVLPKVLEKFSAEGYFFRRLGQ